MDLLIDFQQGYHDGGDQNELLSLQFLQFGTKQADLCKSNNDCLHSGEMLLKAGKKQGEFLKKVLDKWGVDGYNKRVLFEPPV